MPKRSAMKFEGSILSQLLEIQKQFQGNHFPLRDIEISSLASAIASEAMELWSMTGKWWYEQEYNLEKIKEESIDIFHFLLGLWLKLDMNESEIVKLYKEKMRVNVERQVKRRK